MSHPTEFETLRRQMAEERQRADDRAEEVGRLRAELARFRQLAADEKRRADQAARDRAALEVALDAVRDHLEDEGRCPDCGQPVAGVTCYGACLNGTPRTARAV